MSPGLFFETRQMSIGALIVAAGRGTRLGAKDAKAFVDLAGTSMLVRSVCAITSAVPVESMVVVVPAGQTERAEDLVRQVLRPGLDCVFVAGGEERQESVRNGLDVLAQKCDVVLVHDAARPLVPRSVVGECIRVASEKGAAIAALPSTDTLKEVSEEGQVVRTLDRARIWTVQTPQAFRVKILCNAHARAAAEGFSATDDAALVERYGGSVWAVRGDPRNRKITTPEDLAWARCLLESETGPR